MKNKIGILILCLFCQFCFGQIESRKTLKGQVRNDLAPVENVIVFDANSKTGAIVNEYGFFTVLAKVNDTLVFSSLTFKSKKVVLKEEDFITPQFIVTLEVFTNELKEVLIAAKKELSPILGESQKYVDLMYFGDQKSALKNAAMPRNGSIEYGTNFVRIYNDVLKILRKNNPEKVDFYKETSFSELVLKRINYSFFSNTLNLKDDEIKLFLVFCENDSKSRTLMQPSAEFQLMDFLITKNKEYKKITTF
ncbi:hypothetical protein [Flavobacterium sp. ACAM 123]|jgi:hypothetical protein|uniref:hypothetical protein n=1 Tax=Flavobacterium sp. ACAM 123 TaxID=1189620 RepID=UPI0002D9FCC1|nr:hypothetical protein [Flavobacterium sp. ACAM 123]